MGYVERQWRRNQGKGMGTNVVEQTGLVSGELSIFISSKRPIPAHDFAQFLLGIEKVARRRHMGSSMTMDIVELETGSVKMRLRFTSAQVSAAAAVGTLLLGVAQMVLQPKGNAVNIRIANMIVVGDADQIVLETHDKRKEIKREQIPQVRSVEDRLRRRSAAEERVEERRVLWEASGSRTPVEIAGSIEMRRERLIFRSLAGNVFSIVPGGNLPDREVRSVPFIAEAIPQNINNDLWIEIVDFRTTMTN